MNVYLKTSLLHSSEVESLLITGKIEGWENQLNAKTGKSIIALSFHRKRLPTLQPTFFMKKLLDEKFLRGQEANNKKVLNLEALINIFPHTARAHKPILRLQQHIMRWVQCEAMGTIS